MAKSTKRIQKVGGEVEEFVLTNYILMQSIAEKIF